MNDVSPTRDSSSSGVHIGTWINWSHGPILGATLTLDRQSGGLLIAALALFIAWAGTSFWRICCFVSHQVYSSNTAQDGLYHQRQALLRNSGSPWHGLTSLLHTGWAWRRNSKLSFCRTLPMVFCAALCACAFAIASIFSSMVSTSSGNEVLISSPDCGYTSAQLDNPDTLAAQTFEPYLRQNALSYAQYAQQCYQPNASTVVDCSQFVKKNLSGTAQTDASCAFADNICQRDSANLALDTGLLDSNQDFGLNSPPEETFQYRRRVQCAPLKTDDYKKPYRARSGRRYMRYYYGERVSGGVQADDYTYEYYDNSLADLIETNMTSAPADYTLSGFRSFSINSTLSPAASEFLPIPPLRIPNADVSIFFLSGNQIIYTVPTNDSWYRGDRLLHAPAPPPIPAPEPGTQGPYFSSEAASPLACAVQEQYCSASLPPDRRCSALASSADALADITSKLLTDDEAGVHRLQWFVASTTGRAPDLSTAVGRLGAQLLTGRYRLSQDGVQGGLLPDGQWQADVMHWHAMTMAALQDAFVQTATGPPGDGVLLPWLVRPSSPVEEAMCRNQKILSRSHTSFALFPLLLILAAGVLVILTSWCLPYFLVFIARRRLIYAHRHRSLPSSPESPPTAANNASTDTPQPTTATATIPTADVADPTTYARYEWLATSTPQLIRLAHEDVPGLSTTWTRAGTSIPVTTRRHATTTTTTASGINSINTEKPTPTTPTATPNPTPNALAILDLSTPTHPRLAPAPPPSPPTKKQKNKKKSKPLSLLASSGARDGPRAGSTSGGVEMRSTTTTTTTTTTPLPKLLPEIKLCEVSGSTTAELGGGEGDRLGEGDADASQRSGSGSTAVGVAVKAAGDAAAAECVAAHAAAAHAAHAAAGTGVGGGAGAGAGAGLGGGREREGATTTGGGRRARETREEQRRREIREREDVLLSEPLLPDYENWPLPPSGSLTPTGEGEAGEREGERERRRRDGGGGGGGDDGVGAGDGGEQLGAGRVRRKRSEGAFL
ncbi:cytochrome p450 protein [Diplodia corticola]|uniref:Cytochrome p450 protein n=1 Tax=Diplodia corticola TaxID=236234 RepID=A0A1J9SAM4_9PEZI|nr:cytochrome p450 protein [Diplodia corticola]OJD36629.1 cytochrome p450 protein [Diplodia corticola]